MNKKFINGLLLATLVVGSAGSFTSCKDYDDDIDNLQNQIDKINVDLGALQEKINSGKVITGIAQTSNGVDITLSDGQVLTLKNGKDGENGAPGTTWTIGADGYWYENGKKTDYRAIGEQGPAGEKGDKGDKGDQGDKGDKGDTGATGDKGDKGDKGDAGENGEYYVPESDGYFWIYKDGQKIKNSNISWKAQTLSAVFTGNTLTLGHVQIGTNADGSPIYGDKVIDLGISVGSIEFIPTRISKDLPYATTDVPFYTLTSYISETKYESANKTVFVPQTNWSKSNVVELRYRVNPSNAFVADGAIASFIGRTVSRAADDIAYPLTVLTNTTEDAAGNKTVHHFTKNGGEITLQTMLNNTKSNIAALYLWNGQEKTISDYVAIENDEITATLVDSAKMKGNAKAELVKFYDRDRAFTSSFKETSANIQTYFCALNADANVDMKFDGQLDLTLLPGLLATEVPNWLDKLGFDGVHYVFTLPEEYRSDDAQKTNQQWFVQLDKDAATGHYILKANAKNLVNGLTPAIGRTPVVRVDAFVNDNAGKAHMVASAYIKVNIVDVIPDDPENLGDLPAVNIINGAAPEYKYQNLKETQTAVGEMNWTRVNNEIYGITGFTSSTFWNYYGGDKNEYTVTVTATTTSGTQASIINDKGEMGVAKTFTNDGIFLTTGLFDGNTQTSNIKLAIDNMVKTQHTYKNVDGKGAEYTVTIKINADDNTKNKNVVITQKFYVLCLNNTFDFNPNYYVENYAGYHNVVITKGQLVKDAQNNEHWALQMNISEVFAMVNGKNIFQYYKDQAFNTKAIDFSLQPATQTGVDYKDQTTGTEPNGLIFLNAPLSTPFKVAQMQYMLTLVNGEKCGPTNFNIYFKNPFVAGNGAALSLNGNKLGAVTVDVKPSVAVNDVDGNAIYTWNKTALELSSVATNIYKLAAPTVTYAFDETAQDYKDFVGNLDPKSTFKLDPKTGVVTYENLGATLVKT